MNWSPQKIDLLFGQTQKLQQRRFARLALKLTPAIRQALVSTMRGAGFIKGGDGEFVAMLDALVAETNGKDPVEDRKRRGIASLLGARGQAQSGKRNGSRS